MDYMTAFVLLAILVLDVIASIKLVHFKTLDEKVKRLNLILVWLIPLVWAIIVIVQSDDPPKKTGKRDKQSHNYMSSGYPMP